MIRRGRTRALAAAGAAALLRLASPAAAQEPAAALRGVVVDTAGNPVPFALVRVLPATSEQFAGARGGFGAAGLAPGTYRVQVRQVGFVAFDSTLTLAAGGTALRVVLRPLAIRLDELAVSAPGRCTDPGPPDSASSPELAAIFAQLRENARRYEILADSYPYLYAIERRFTDFDKAGVAVAVSTDTVEYRSDQRDRYRPGEVIVARALGRDGIQRAVRLPILPDLADSAFHATHCFAFAGVVEQDGERRLRVSFRVAARLSAPDLEGETDLDPDTYQLRTLTFRVTRPSRGVPDLRSVDGTMTLRALHPYVVVPDAITSTQVSVSRYLPRWGWSAPRVVERQRLVRVRFLRPLPSDSAPAP